MAQDQGRPSTADKGKGKVDDMNGDKDKAEEVKGDKVEGKATPEKDGKPTENGKVVDGVPEGNYYARQR